MSETLWFLLLGGFQKNSCVLPAFCCRLIQLLTYPEQRWFEFTFVINICLKYSRFYYKINLEWRISILIYLSYQSIRCWILFLCVAVQIENAEKKVQSYKLSNTEMWETNTSIHCSNTQGLISHLAIMTFIKICYSFCIQSLKERILLFRHLWLGFLRAPGSMWIIALYTEFL